MTTIAAILVGGKGTRLRSLIDGIPKPLADVAGEPFLFLILRVLAQTGIKKVILLTSYLHEKIVEACGNGEQFGLEILYSEEKKALGTAGAIGHARSLLKSYSDFILLNGDTYLECKMQAFFQAPLKKNSIGMMGVMQFDETKRYGTVLLNPTTGHIEQFREKDPNSSSGLVSSGVYKLSTEILNFIPENTVCSLEIDIFPKLLDQKFILQSYLLDGTFCDIGIPESYLSFNLHRLVFASGLNFTFQKILLYLINIKMELSYES